MRGTSLVRRAGAGERKVQIKQLDPKLLAEDHTYAIRLYRQGPLSSTPLTLS